MKILTIGQDNFSIPNMDGHEIDCYIPTDNLPVVIKYVQQSNADVIIIQAEQTAPESELYGGVEFLIWLRIKGIKTHIVLVSFFSLESLIKNTKKAFILGAEGSTFSKMPFLPSCDELAELSNNRSKDDNLKRYLSAIFDIVHFRHAYANVWGLKRLVEVHNEINIEKFTLEKYMKPNDFSLNFHIALFYYKQKNEQLEFSQRKRLNDLSIKLKQIKGLNIIYIDDKAETGYTDFLQMLFDKSCKIFPVKIDEKDNVQSLYHKFESNWHKNNGIIDFIISDLRLFPSEEILTNYKDFVSIKLMCMIFDKRDGRRLKFEKLKYLLFTASNQFFNFKNAFEKNKYAPSDIFVKEGFDNSVIPNHKYKNYEHLLSSLIDLSKSKYRTKILALGKNDEEYNIIKDDFLNNFIFDTWKKEYDKVSSELEKYEFVILDSNIFLLNRPIIPIYCNNVVISYPVFEELKRIERADKKDESFIFEYSSWFTNHYSGLVVKECLSYKSIKEIDALLEQGKKDVADEYFVEILQYFQNALDLNEKILFISNDTNDKETNFSKKSPVTLVKEWIEYNKINNVDVATFRDDKLQIINQQSKHGKIIPSIKKAKNIDYTSNTQGIIKKQRNDNPVIKWNDCELLSNGYELKTKFNSQNIIIRIGAKFTPGFKTYFEKLQKTSDEMVLIFNEGGNNYNIQNLSGWLIKAKKL